MVNGLHMHELTMTIVNGSIGPVWNLDSPIHNYSQWYCVIRSIGLPTRAIGVRRYVGALKDVYV